MQMYTEIYRLLQMANKMAKKRQKRDFIMFIAESMRENLLFVAHNRRSIQMHMVALPGSLVFNILCLCQS